MGDHEAHGRVGLSRARAGGSSADEQDEAAWLEAGRKLFAQPCDFVTGVADLAQLPPMRLPEVAFSGRSNVGKSSLINALTGRRQLARISQTPGRTQQINLFDLGGRLTLVDLPGYGYAQAPKPTVEAWQRLVRAYLRGRASLRRTCVLVDARHGLKDNDRAVHGHAGRDRGGLSAGADQGRPGAPVRARRSGRQRRMASSSAGSARTRV